MKRSPIILVAVPLLVMAIIGLAMQWGRGGTPLPLRDFPEYWSAAKAFLDGRNPYDAAVLIVYQNDARGDAAEDQPMMMWNPPWTLPLVAPLGLLPAKIAHPLWLLTQLACVLGSVLMLLIVYDIPKHYWFHIAVTSLVFSPLFILICYGQIGGFCLLGLAGFLYFESRRHSMTAGAFAALTALKPHLLFAFGLMLILNAMVSARGRRNLAGGALAILAAVLAAWLINPLVFAYYLDSIRAPTDAAHVSVRDWHLPLVSYQLRVHINQILNVDRHANFWIQFIPTLIISIGIFTRWSYRRFHCEWNRDMPILVFTSVLGAAYGAWLFDLVVLLVAVVHASMILLKFASRKTAIIMLMVYSLLNIACSIVPIILPTGVGLQEFIFFGPAMLALWLAAIYLTRGRS